MIEKMKKARIAVLKEDKDKLFKAIQRHSAMMIIKEEDEVINDLSIEDENLLQRTKKSIKTLSKHSKKEGLFKEPKVVCYDDFMHDKADTIETISSLERLEEEINTLKTDINVLKDEINVLSPFYDMRYSLNSLHDTYYSKVHIGYINAKKIEEFKSKLIEYGCEFEIYSLVKTDYACMFLNFKEDDKELIDFVHSIGFNETVLEESSLTAKDAIEKKKSIILEKEELIDTYTNEVKGLADNIEDLKILSDQIKSKKKLNSIDYINTMDTTYITGWVPSSSAKALENLLKENVSSYELELSDPKDDDNPPTYTTNSKVVSPFESITDMFSKPKYGEKDPNAVMSFWYWILFGMMVGDVGYGIVLFLATFLFIKLLKPKGGKLSLAKILMYSSITTTLFGVIYNSFFGYSIFGIDGILGPNELMEKITFSPLNAAITMLIVSIIAGALHLITGLIVKAISDIKNGEVLDMLAGEASWILILVGIGLYALSMFVDSIKYIDYIGLGMIIVGVLFIILFKGRKKKGVVKKFLFGLLGLYDVTSYLSDLLSYTRIMALVMSSAAVAMVMNILAEMIQGSIIGIVFSVVIYIVGHLFNLVLGLLSAYVHDSRLQYIEFYGKFYEGGGYEYKPLSYDTDYIYKIEDKIELKEN